MRRVPIAIVAIAKPFGKTYKNKKYFSYFRRKLEDINHSYVDVRRNIGQVQDVMVLAKHFSKYLLRLAHVSFGPPTDERDELRKIQKIKKKFLERLFI